MVSPSFDNIVSQKFRHLAVAYIMLLLTYLLLLSPCHAVDVPAFAGLTAVAVALGNFFSLWILICQFFLAIEQSITGPLAWKNYLL
jgi:hypothetical protein